MPIVENNVAVGLHLDKTQDNIPPPHAIHKASFFFFRFVTFRLSTYLSKLRSKPRPQTISCNRIPYLDTFLVYWPTLFEPTRDSMTQPDFR
jgi:hypothetical protein